MRLKEYLQQNQTFKWFSLKTDQIAKVLPLREMHEAIWVVEHSNPGNWREKSICTILSGQCIGCINAKNEPFSSWRQRPMCYLDLEVNGEVMLMGQSLTPSNLPFKFLNYETISDKCFLVTRAGNGKKAKYLIDSVQYAEPTKKKLNIEKIIKH